VRLLLLIRIWVAQLKYSLKPTQSFSKGLRRIAITQIDQAARHIGADYQGVADVHNARKCFKRVRALLDLAEPALDKAVHRRQDKRFRDLGRALAGARDIAVMIQQLDAMTARGEIDAAARMPRALRSWLLVRADDAKAALEHERRSTVVAELDAARAAAASLAISDRGFDVVAQGFAASYAQGAAAYARAYHKRAGAKAFHDWRKYVQRHWRQCQLLRAAWPAALDARIALASELSEIIGEDHDLAVLIAFVQHNRAILGAPDELCAFIKACERRQTQLRADARPRGARLYAASPKAMAKMLKTYWLSSQRIESKRPDIRSPAARLKMLV
jgi:hypothetical protein